MSAHSSLVGGSSADRLLHCPGSYQAIMKLPELPEIASEAANEGTFGHAVMDALLRARMADSTTDLKEEARVWLGSTFHDRQLQQRHLDELIYPALDALADLEDKLRGDFKVLGVELKMAFPGVPAAFGTIDLILQNDHWVIIVDYKFGSWEVSTVHSDDQDDLVKFLNPQLAYYACAALHTKPKWFTGRGIAIAIIQPRGDKVLDHTEVFRKELKDFAEDVQHAAGVALGRDPPLIKGRWCKWCQAKPICPQWTGPLLNLVALQDATPQNLRERSPFAYGDFLSRAREFSDLVGEYGKEVDRQLQAFLEAGGQVPGWALVPKKKLRQWIDEPLVADELRNMGFAEDQIWQRKLVTFGSADATAKRRGIRIPDYLRVAPPSTEMVPARVGGHVPAIDKSTVIEQLKASVALLNSRKG